MPEIIGPFTLVSSSVPALDSHVGHLKHLAQPGVARQHLQERFGLTSHLARDTSKIISAHVAQALEFHNQGRRTSISIRPVLQYYSYLNLAVAAILAYRPRNFNQYRRHGVEDKTHALNSLTLSSKVLKVNHGAVPLFHSIISDVSLSGRQFRLGHLAAGFHMASHELKARFGKTTQRIIVSDQIVEISGSYHSEFSFRLVGDESGKISSKRVEDAMPLLRTHYKRRQSSDETLVYKSIASWPSQDTAFRSHKVNGIKLINFGGHLVVPALLGNPSQCHYMWCGVSRIPLLPTLTSVLLMSFSLASVARYRPSLLNKALNSSIHLIIDTFIQEADAIFIPALRNLLYREEIAIGLQEYS